VTLEYMLAVTSCERHDLLQRTMDSFFEHADVLPSKAIILEDGHNGPGILPCNDLYNVKAVWRNNPERLGQIRSCDRLMEMVETEWVFWCEDDWLFKEGNFIVESYGILERYPEIFTVSLRGRAWNHPLRESAYPFLIAEPGWSDGWGGMCFNPGLRRKSDYLKMGPYAQGGLNMWACQSEHELSRRYLKAGYRIADLGRPIIEHLGHGRSKTKENF
jgi:hypothetical protein